MKAAGKKKLFPCFLFFVVLLFPEPCSGVLLLEFLDPAGFCDPRTTFPRIERMAGGTDSDLDLFHSGTGLKGISAGTGHATLLVFRVYVLFHLNGHLLALLNIHNE